MVATKRKPHRLEDGSRGLLVLITRGVALFIIRRESSGFFFGYTTSQAETAKSMKVEPVHTRISKQDERILSGVSDLSRLSVLQPQLQEALDAYDARVEKAKEERETFLNSIADIVTPAVTPG